MEPALNTKYEKKKTVRSKCISEELYLAVDECIINTCRTLTTRGLVQINYSGSCQDHKKHNQVQLHYPLTFFFI